MQLRKNLRIFNQILKDFQNHKFLLYNHDFKTIINSKMLRFFKGTFAEV